MPPDHLVFEVFRAVGFHEVDLGLRHGGFPATLTFCFLALSFSTAVFGFGDTNLNLAQDLRKLVFQ